MRRSLGPVRGAQRAPRTHDAGGARRTTLHLLSAFALALALTPRPAAAYELGEGFVELHGFYQMEFRGIADSFELSTFNPHQWAHTFNLEAEFDLLPDGWGPISLLQAFVRVEARYDCVWQSMCHIATGQRLWGDQANRAPSQFTNGRTSGVSGRFPNPANPSEPIHGSGARLIGLTEIPPFDQLLGIGGEATAAAVDRLFAPVSGFRFAVKHQQGSVAPTALPLGPWTPKDVRANGALRNINRLGSPASLPLRPTAPDDTYYTPSQRLLSVKDDFDHMALNYSENELEWNRGASQQQVKELREAYLDIDLLDGQLFIRAGRQTTVWGKTELFRAQDQFNPQDIALATLSSLESSRIPLWSIRAIWSFWDVGPFQDVRLEFATNLDEFQPTDLGICGEPYTPWLVCLKKAGAMSHGLFGFGLAGEVLPDDPWDSSRGLEAGLRLEFRWGRFSFAITDFYGFPDVFTVDNFNVYERNVDEYSGRARFAGSRDGCDPEMRRPLDDPLRGDTSGCLTVANAATHQAGNRQFFDVVCGATFGIAASVFPGVFESDCLLDIFNTDETLILEVRQILAQALGGGSGWNTFGGGVLLPSLGAPPGSFLPAIALHGGPFDDDTLAPAEQYTLALPTCGNALTDEQEALLGTGVYFHPDDEGVMPYERDLCLGEGIDIFHAEASVILEAFPQFDGTVATRFVQGLGQLRLPGSRGPGEDGYDPNVDGCVMDLPDIAIEDGGDEGICDEFDNIVDPDDVRAPLVDPRTGEVFRSEMTVLSYNFMALLAALSKVVGEPEDSEDCFPADGGLMVDQSRVVACSLVRGLFGIAGAQRPEISAGGNGRYGRRDFLWHGGAEARLIYGRRNVLGFSMDFAEDRTKTNWGVEFVWFEDQPYGDSHEVDGWSKHDTLSLTVSVDRPTFVNFLNSNRTIFFNAQFFVRWIDGYTDKRLTPDGPFSLLGTFTFFTGFWQDRLLTAVTAIHELESNSGGLIVNLSYRMTENFSMSVGLTTFHGDPRSMRSARTPISLSSTLGNDYESRSRYNGLSAVSDREELYVTLRYTF